MKIYSYDGFEIVIQAGETLSGAVLLATMVILTGAITTLTDRRNESVFQLYSDWGSEPEKQNVITTNTTIETDTTKAKTFRLTDYAGNDTFVTADLSGVQHIKYPAKSGILVVSDYSPTMPVLPRIGSVECARDRSHNVNVLLRWNFDNCRGTVLGNHFNMTDASGGMGTIQANALAGLFLEIDNITYGIISNLVTSAGTTVITFGTIYGGAIDLPNMTISSDNRAHITSGCTSYDIFAISNSGQYYEYSATVGVDLGHIAQAIMLTLKNGVDYTFEVRATTPAEKTSWASFVVTATLPNITADGTVDVQGGVSGTAIIAIGGWATAESFLISYSSTANASFYDEHSTTIESFERRVSIPYASNNDLDVLVKPMQSGQVVGTEVQAMMGQIQYSDMIGAPAVQRDKFAIPFGFSNNDGGLAKFAGINFVGGIPMPRSGCITKVRFTTTLGAVKSLSTAFVDPPVGQGAPASNRFTDTGKVSIEFNAVDSLWYPIIDGQQCPEMILAYQPAEGVGDGFIEGGILYGEFDND